MNPIAIVLIIIALTLIIVGFKGKQDNLISAILNRKFGNSTLS